MTTEVWISTRGPGKIPETTWTAIYEDLEADNTKDTPSFGSEDLEDIYRAGTEAGLLGIYNFPGAVYATDGSNDKGVMGAGFCRLDENRGGCCQMGRGKEGNSPNRAELGAECLALEDAKKETGQETSNPPFRLGMLPIPLPEMDRGGKIPFHVGKPGRRHHERHSTTSMRTGRTRPSYCFH